jgi:hypothetical protein
MQLIEYMQALSYMHSNKYLLISFPQMLFSAWIKEVEVLKEEVRTMLTSATLKPSEKLKLMDIVLRLGIGYHFEGEINDIIEHAYNTYHGNNFDDDLFTVALRFRLLRQYGYNVSSGKLSFFLIRRKQKFYYEGQHTRKLIETNKSY